MFRARYVLGLVLLNTCIGTGTLSASEWAFSRAMSESGTERLEALVTSDEAAKGEKDEVFTVTPYSSPPVPLQVSPEKPRKVPKLILDGLIPDGEEKKDNHYGKDEEDQYLSDDDDEDQQQSPSSRRSPILVRLKERVLHSAAANIAVEYMKTDWPKIDLKYEDGEGDEILQLVRAIEPHLERFQEIFEQAGKGEFAQSGRTNNPDGGWTGRYFAICSRDNGQELLTVDVLSKFDQVIFPTELRVSVFLPRKKTIVSKTVAINWLLPDTRQ